MTDAPKQPTIADLMALVADLKARLDAAEAAAPVVVTDAGPVEYARAPWSEKIRVEALADCTYPDPQDEYPKYRYGRSDGQPGSVFLLKHREHLNKHLRELGKDEAAPERVAPAIPQTGARGQRVRQQQV